MAGEDEGKPLTGYAKRRLSTKVTFGARDLPKENAISDMENIEEMPEKIELDPQATPVMKAPGTIKKPSSPPPAPVSGDDAKQFTGPTGYDARRLSTSLKFQGKERPKENAIADVENPEDVDQALTEVVMGGMRMFLPQAQADAMVASGSASLPGSEPEPVVEEVKAEPVAAVKKEPVAAAKAEPVAAAKEEPAAELMEVFMGGVAMMLPTAQAQALLASGGAQKSGAAAPAPAPVPDPVAAAPAPVAAAPAPVESDELMEVSMGGVAMMLPKAQAQAMLASGAAQEPGAAAPAPAPAPVPAPVAAAPAPAPAPVASDELMEVSMGGSSMMLPKAQAQALLASGAAQVPGAAAPAPAPAPVPAPVAAAPAPAPAPAARAPAPAAAAAAPATPSDSLMEVFLGSKGIMVPVAEATAMLAAGAVTAQAPVPVVEEPLKLKMVNVAGRDLMLPMDQAMEMLANGSARPIAAERAPKDEGTAYGLVEVNVDGSNIMVPDNVVDAMCAAGVAKRTAPKPVASLPVASAPKAPAAAAASEELVEVLINGQSVFVPATQAGSLVAFGAAQRADSVPKPPAPAPAPAPVAAAPAPVSDPDALVEVNMNGMNMFLPAGQAEQMISMGMASRV
eukprot:CAMPEP_0194742898 /NCGR_PEP_ID=MMETSP0296-20130528/100015_1 /TAXON_ID=39354 /ORGANISM="Heterosigma akashiwo, Strain CCMP2393" /LENGTH=622 /DNA_ID=CAMNT_0039654873 /DNA_START=218 /DNA_END=2086 /DNA_ORIENTATION=-